MTSRQFFLLSAPLVAIAVGGCPAARTSPQRPIPKVTVAAGSKPSAVPAPLKKIAPPPGVFFTKPYLQLGQDASEPGSLSVVWHTPTAEAPQPGTWSVETRSPAGTGGWQKQAYSLESTPVTVQGVVPHSVCAAALRGLSAGEPFDYRILRKGIPVFAARANRARPAAGQAFRMVLFGDCAEDTAWQKKVAYQTFLLRPDAVLITGDIVYPHGRASEYRANYFPVYSRDVADPKHGAPLLSSTLFIGVSGNHDLAYANLAKYPDGLAYYYYWKQPLNGWGGASSGEHPPVKGEMTAFSRASGKSYPVGGNFSFDYGNAHFVAIDANHYMNWRSPKMVAGLRKAILANPAAKWRFVVLHVPPFHSSATHQSEQWMRRLAPVFEETGVDVVWSGHIHNYQRSYPLRFQPSETAKSDGTVDGTFSLDTVFDGTRVTKPRGVLYVVTGAGGAALYKKPAGSKSGDAELQEFTAKYAADVHSLTEISVQDTTLAVRQLDENGKEVDRWSVTK